jgi:hypothetical protein
METNLILKEFIIEYICYFIYIIVMSIFYIKNFCNHRHKKFINKTTIKENIRYFDYLIKNMKMKNNFVKLQKI